MVQFWFSVGLFLGGQHLLGVVGVLHDSFFGSQLLHRFRVWDLGLGVCGLGFTVLKVYTFFFKALWVLDFRRV